MITAQLFVRRLHARNGVEKGSIIDIVEADSTEINKLCRLGGVNRRESHHAWTYELAFL